MTAAQRDLLETLAECDRAEMWRDDDCRDLAHWVSIHLGVSEWWARRWISAAHALPQLPRVNDAFVSGELCLDKVAELCRFATPATEQRLIPWAKRVTTPAIRRRADLERRRSRDEVVAAERTRHLSFLWNRDEGADFLDVYGHFPADQGAVLIKAIDRLAERLPDVIETDRAGNIVRRDLDDTLDERRADALVAMASRAVAEDQDADRATVVVIAPVEALSGDVTGCEIEHGPAIHPETARRLACDARLQVVLEGRNATVVGVGRTTRTAPAWLVRQLRRRDRGCSFPGCARRWYLHAHHIVHWAKGGSTDLENLTLACTWHHKLVHEHGWSVSLDAAQVAVWTSPDGKVFEPGLARAGPAPPATAA